MFTAFSLFPEEVSSTLTLSEKFGTVLSTAVVGYLVVFTVLALIWGILEIFGKVFNKKTDKAVTLPAPEPAAIPVAEADNDNTEEIVAAITAAISMYSDKPASSFRVVSFRKK